jgi:hypothetical protein
MLSIEGVQVEFSGSGIITLRDGEQKIHLSEWEAKELVMQIVNNRIVSGQNNHGVTK